MTIKMWRQTIVVSCIVLLTSAEDYESNLTKLWSIKGAKSGDGSRTAIVNVSDSISIKPSPEGAPRRSKVLEPSSYQGYRFIPRAIPLKKEPAQARSVYYSPDNNKQKSEILFPGNYFAIAEEKSKENLTQDAYNPLQGGPFQPQSIPLIRGDFVGRSLDSYEEPIIEKPEGFTEQAAQRRSISYLLGVDGDEDEDEDEDGDGEYEVVEEEDGVSTKSKKKIKKPKVKKLGKYMLPLLLAYKMKYFAMVPLMIAGLVLLVGATGLAGFFFALFAAVMGLQKGSY